MERLPMRERRVLVKAFAGSCRKARKKGKGTIPERFMEATGYQRRHAAYRLRSHGRQVRLGPRVVVQGDVAAGGGPRGRGRRYGAEARAELVKLWRMLD